MLLEQKIYSRSLCTINCTKPAKNLLGWEPTVDFAGLVQLMVQSDLEEVKKEVATQMDISFSMHNHKKELELV